MAASFLMLWIIGFMGAVVFLPFLYLRLHKETWLLSITLSLGCGVFFYLLFGLVVKMPLYPGILGEKIWG
jgi:predicted branched-subunit amino acid permease